MAKPSTENELKTPQKKADRKFGFATPEHKRAGDGVALYYIDAAKTKQPLLPQQTNMVSLNLDGSPSESSNLKLSYGDILALAGDYYALADSVIAEGINDEDRSVRFIQSFNMLANSNQKETDKIFKINNTTYSSNDSLNEYRKQFNFLLLLGRKYFTMTNNNLDHFEPWSTKAYEIGHAVALEMAKKAYELREQNPSESKKYLTLAYQMNAYACHFLSDSFSSGHLRLGIIRKTLSKRFGFIGGILVNNMHNEDSRLGVNVYNDHNKYWRAYGDDNYLKPDDNNNRNIQAAALQESANEVFSTYEKGLKPENSVVANYIPKVDTSKPQNAPMFILENNKVFYRNPINELNSDKVRYEELTRFQAFCLAVKLRLFPSSYEPKFTPEKTEEVTIDNVYHRIPRGNNPEEPIQRNELNCVASVKSEQKPVETVVAVDDNVDTKGFRY